MLVVARRHNEVIHIGDDIHITIVRIDQNSVRVGIEAPKEMLILRDELLDDEEDESFHANT